MLRAHGRPPSADTKIVMLNPGGDAPVRSSLHGGCDSSLIRREDLPPEFTPSSPILYGISCYVLQII